MYREKILDKELRDECLATYRIKCIKNEMILVSFIMVMNSY